MFEDSSRRMFLCRSKETNSKFPCADGKAKLTTQEVLLFLSKTHCVAGARNRNDKRRTTGTIKLLDVMRTEHGNLRPAKPVRSRSPMQTISQTLVPTTITRTRGNTGSTSEAAGNSTYRPQCQFQMLPYMGPSHLVRCAGQQCIVRSLGREFELHLHLFSRAPSHAWAERMPRGHVQKVAKEGRNTWWTLTCAGVKKIAEFAGEAG